MRERSRRGSLGRADRRWPAPVLSGLALVMMLTGPSPGCDAGRPVVQSLTSSGSDGASGATPPDPPRPGDADSGPSLTTTESTTPDGGGEAQCGDRVCEFDWQCVEARCCSFLQACQTVCCGEDEHCNVYQCYRPLLCGPGLPACPEKTYCEDYEEGRRSCANHEHRLANREFCARMDAGSEWLKAHGRSPGGPEARGTCFPVLAPHRMGVIRWYRALGKSVTSMSR